MKLRQNFDEVTIVFDTYKPDSMKSTTGQKRLQGKDPVQYQVRDETSITHMTMSRFLFHEKTKALLAAKPLEYSHISPRLVIVSASGHTKGNGDVGSYSENSQEEADTLMIGLAVSGRDETLQMFH